jgi:xylitol oxidase
VSATAATVTNWAGNLSFGTARVHRPRSLDELRRVVAGSERIRALGSGHSFSKVVEPAGDLVRLDALPPSVAVDLASSTATVRAGMRYAEVAHELQRRGVALANLASLPHISVGGSCATGTHGSGDTQGGLATAVAGLRLVGPEGDLVEVRRDLDRDAFTGMVVALGALGVVTDLTLDVEPTFDVTQAVYVGVMLDDVMSRFDEVFGAAYSVSLFTDWRSGEATMWLKSRADRPACGWVGGRAAQHPLHPVPGQSPRTCTEQLGRAGPWHDRLPHFRTVPDLVVAEELQSEFFLPRSQAVAAFSTLRSMGDVVSSVLQISEVRTVRADDLWLSPGYGRDSVTFHFTWTNDEARVRPVMAAVEERLIDLGSRPHWAKLTTMALPDIRACYTRAEDFERLVQTFDPYGKFSNALVGGLFPGTRRAPAD